MSIYVLSFLSVLLSLVIGDIVLTIIYIAQRKKDKKNDEAQHNEKE